MNGKNIHNDVWIEQWTEDYLRVFEQEKQCITAAVTLSGLQAEIFHVGSTSVRDLPGKEIIDILVCPDTAFTPEAIIPALEGIGYTNLEECGRPGRYFLTKGNKPLETFYLHLCRRDHQVARDQLLFKRILAGSELLRRRYAYAKHLLAYQFSDDRNTYRALKGLFVEGVLSSYRYAIEQDDPSKGCI